MGKTVLASNITALRSHLGLKQAAFAATLDTDQPNVSKWERGMEPGPIPLSKMAELAGCSVRDFMEKEWAPRTASSAEAKRLLPDQQPTVTADATESVGIVRLDLSLAMGSGTLIDDFVESELVAFDAATLRALTRSPFDRLRLVTGVGTSHEPKFHTSDQFLIDINDRQLSRLDGYYWITIYGAHALKRLRPIGRGQVEVLSENPDFAPQVVDAEDLRIEGRAIWVGRAL